MANTGAERLADFVCDQRRNGLPERVLHQAKRLLLNQLKAAAAAALQPAGVALLAQAADAQKADRGSALARLWWTDALAPPAQAAAVNAQLLGMLDFGDTHLPSLGQFTAAIVPTLLAQAEAGAHAGRDLLQALALGLEVGLACAEVEGGGSRSLGAVVACGTLLGMDRTALSTALAEVGAASELSVDGLGGRWRLQDIALHCRPLPVQALAPVDAVLALRPLALGREPRLMQLALSPQAWRLLQMKAPAAADGLCRDLAAAWLLGQFTTDEREPSCRDSPAVCALAARIELLPGGDGDGGIEACSLTAHFEDGASEHVRIDAFLGSAAQPLSDSQLSELFRNAADDLVLPRRSGEILQTLWGLDLAPDSRALLGLLRRA